MKYRITLSQTVTETAVVTVEANDEELAEQTALNLASGVIEPIGPEEEVAWNFTEIEQDAEIIHVDEWPPVNDPDPPETSPAGYRRDPDINDKLQERDNT